MIDDTELARRSIRGFGEMIASLGHWNGGAEAVVRRPDAVGARIAAAADNPWFDAVIVPFGMTPPADDPLLPLCVWTVAHAVPGRVEEPEVATPCMGVFLDAARLPDLGREAANVEPVPLEVLGAMNERAYGQPGVFGPMVSRLGDHRVRAYGLRDDGAFVCVALTLTVGDDLGIHFVATEEVHRRRGLATRLLVALMAAARDDGMRSATLQASADGLSVYERLGFRRVATLRGYLRPGGGK